MKITIERSSFFRCLGHIQSVVEKRAATSTALNVHIQADEKVLRLQAANIDLEIEETLPCEIHSNGCIVASSQVLYDILRKLPDQVRVTIDQQNTGVENFVLSSGNSRFTLRCQVVQNLQMSPRNNLTFHFGINALDFLSILEKTRFAMSSEETRYYINGLYLHILQKGQLSTLCAVATDGHKLASMEIPCPSGASGMPGIIIPRRAVEIIRTLIIGSRTRDITVSISNSKIHLVLGEIAVSAKLIDGTFPDYRRVIPENNDKIIEVNKKLLMDAVARVSSILTFDKVRAVTLTTKDNTLILTASSSTTTNKSIEEVETVSCCPSPISIGFNNRYLLDILEQVTGETVKFTILDAMSPSIISSSGPAFYVLMPMRV